MIIALNQILLLTYVLNSAAGKVTAGLAWHWSCFADTSGYPYASSMSGLRS